MPKGYTIYINEEQRELIQHHLLGAFGELTSTQLLEPSTEELTLLIAMLTRLPAQEAEEIGRAHV